MIADDTHPLVSVIVPTKNRRLLMQETIRSIQEQTYERWEAIVVDDDSDDETWPELHRLAVADPRIRPLRRVGPLGGPHVARNQGLEVARGEFIVFLDSDDLLAPDALGYRVAMAQRHPEADLWVCGSELFFASPGDCDKETAYRVKVVEDVDALDAFLAYYPAWYSSSPLWKRMALARVGSWKTGYSFGEDLEYHIRALVLGLRYKRSSKLDHFIRQHAGVRVGGNDNIHDVSPRIELLDDLLAILSEQGMLTSRRRRLLALSAFWGTIGYATGKGSRPRFKEAIGLWKAARDRGLVGKAGYLIGCVVASSQWLGGLGVATREASRLLFYNYLKRKPLLDPGVLRIFLMRLRWKTVQRLHGLAAEAWVSKSVEREALR